jgi:hypothetical protein
METIRRGAIRYSLWLIAAASATLLVGCGGPYAWNTYIDPGYAEGVAAIIDPSGAPSEVTGAVAGVSPGALRTAVAEAMQRPSVVEASAGATLQGSSTPPDPGALPATRTDWQFSSAAASSGAGTEVHVKATFYRNNTALSVAEGNGVVTGADDPRLQQLIAYVASALVPQIRGGGSGHS